jgi:DNA topoisomerase-2
VTQVSGLSVLGRDRFGVFPLKGKLLNVREASHRHVRDNVEFTAIKTILGLQHGGVDSQEFVGCLSRGSCVC